MKTNKFIIKLTFLAFSLTNFVHSQKVSYNILNNSVKIESKEQFYEVEVEALDCYNTDHSFSEDKITKKYLRGFNKTINIDSLEDKRFIRIILFYGMKKVIFVVDTEINNLNKIR